MSKIFDTLSKGGGELADLIRPLVDDQRAPAPNGGAKPIPKAEPKAERSAQHEMAPVGTADLQWEGVRTLNLRVPAPSPLLPFEVDQPKASEQYRILRTKITQDLRQPRMIVISSPDAGDGKSVSAINTAAALSLKSETRTLLVDADLRRSTDHLLLGLPAMPGLSEVLQGKIALEQAIVRTREFPNLFVLTAGTTPANPVELLDSAQWSALCARLRQTFRFTIVDSPPVAAVADYDLIQAACDAVILVVRPDHTNRDLLAKALESVPKGKSLGVLLNCVPNWSLSRGYGVDHYYQYRAAEPSTGK